MPFYAEDALASSNMALDGLATLRYTKRRKPPKDTTEARLLNK